MFPADIHDLARKTIETYASAKKRIVTAESCTGGLIAAALTEIPGASDVVERGFITYSNDAKIDLLGVLPEFLEQHGAVSAEVAEAMAQGALEYSLADVAVSVTGIAGPTGGMPAKPVGLVYIGLATRSGVLFHLKCQFKGDRSDIREQAVAEALRIVSSQASDSTDVPEF
jgi:nicotinamide-nucleotide amidase